MYNSTKIFERINDILCAEQPAEYGQSKLIPFYYSPEKKIKLFQGDALSILKKIPNSCIDMIFADKKEKWRKIIKISNQSLRQD